MDEKKTLAFEMLEELKKSGQRKFIIIVILIIALIGSNVAWLVYESQFETIYEEESNQVIENTENSVNTTYTQTIH